MGEGHGPRPVRPALTGTVESRAFPAWVAFCTAVSVAVATGITIDDSVPARIGAGLAGLAVGVGLAYALAAVLPAPRGRQPSVAVAPPAPAAAAVPEAAMDDRRSRLEAQLAAADPDGDVGAWIASTQAAVDELVPGASGYFAALGSRTFADDRTRLDAHVARLRTIVRDFL